MKLPYRINATVEAAIGVMTAVPVVLSPFFYSRFPARVATHWGVNGEPNGWSGPEFAAFFFPALIVFLYFLMLFLPALDPQKDRYREFGRAYQVVRLTLAIFFTVVYLASSLNGIGYELPINQIVLPGIGLMFLALGNFMPKFRKNWFVGIRTPWTLSSETVWNRTHRFGGKAFMLAGLAFLASAFLAPSLAFIVTMVAVAVILFATVFYSWWMWRQLPPEERNPCKTAPPPVTDIPADGG